MIILCSGMPRSASTWSYNVSRLLLAAAAHSYTSGYVGEGIAVDTYIQEKQAASPQDDILLKAHAPGSATLELIQARQVKNIYTYRDPRDSLCSWMAFENLSFEEVLERVSTNLRFYQWCQTQSDTLFIRFEDMRANPACEIERIASYLDLPLSQDIYQTIEAQTSLEASRAIANQLQQSAPDQVFQAGDHVIDRTTLLHEGHIAGAKVGRWQDELTQTQQVLLHCRLRPWLLALNYETEDSFSRQLHSWMTQIDWQTLAHRFWMQENYPRAIELYEQAMVLEPENHGYAWRLGLLLLLQGQDEEAQSLWFADMAGIDPDSMDTYLTGLGEVLQQEAQRREAASDYATAWMIRQYVREILPTEVNNLLHLVNNSLQLEQFTPEDLDNWEIIPQLQRGESPVDQSLLDQVQANLASKFPEVPSTQAFIMACQNYSHSHAP